jgi:hypothetical protein
MGLAPRWENSRSVRALAPTAAQEISVNRILTRTALAAAMTFGALAITSAPASARVVCNASGDCWHTDNRVNYGPKVRLQTYPDSWYFHQKWADDKQRHWRDHHDGRGYYDQGVWVGR